MGKKISVIVVNYNTQELTVKCLKSIYRYPIKASFEVILIDNGSTASFKLSKEFLGKVKLIKNAQNLGFSKANNQGIREAKGEYIFLLNSDAEVTNGAIDKLVEFAQNSKNAGVVGARLLNPDGTIQPSVYRLPSIANAVKQYFLNKKNLLDKYYPKEDSPVEVEAVVGAAFLITPQALKRIGMLNEKYFMYFEDLDYCRSVRKSGLKVYYLPEAEVLHKHGASGGKNEMLVKSSKIYFGELGHLLYNAVLNLGQKWQKLLA